MTEFAVGDKIKTKDGTVRRVLRTRTKCGNQQVLISKGNFKAWTIAAHCERIETHLSLIPTFERTDDGVWGVDDDGK